MACAGRSCGCIPPARSNSPAQETEKAALTHLLSDPLMIFTKRSLPWDKASQSRELLLSREWLVSNGLGGFASGTISGAITRRYHGLLIAALPAPYGRMVMWSHVSEHLRFDDGETISLGAEER